MIVYDVVKLVRYTARTVDKHAEREKLKFGIGDWKSESLLIDEVAPSADNLTDKHGYYYEVDDVEIIGLLLWRKVKNIAPSKPPTRPPIMVIPPSHIAMIWTNLSRP